MARPMQLIGAGSPKEDIVARLMRVVLLIGLAAAWRPDAAAAQYSWSNFSASVGFGTGSARLGIVHPTPPWIPCTISTSTIPAGTTPTTSGTATRVTGGTTASTFGKTIQLFR